MEMVIGDIEEGPQEDGYRPVALQTSRGRVECRYYPAPDSRRGAVWAGGVGGGWDSPARGRPRAALLAPRRPRHG